LHGIYPVVLLKGTERNLSTSPPNIELTTVFAGTYLGILKVRKQGPVTPYITRQAMYL
jgi:hypothetical protein